MYIETISTKEGHNTKGTLTYQSVTKYLFTIAIEQIVMNSNELLCTNFSTITLVILISVELAIACFMTINCQNTNDDSLINGCNQNRTKINLIKIMPLECITRCTSAKCSMKIQIQLSQKNVVSNADNSINGELEIW